MQDHCSRGWNSPLRYQSRQAWYLADLKVVAIYRPLITVPDPPSGGNIELLFSAGAGDIIGDFQGVQGYFTSELNWLTLDTSTPNQ